MVHPDFASREISRWARLTTVRRLLLATLACAAVGAILIGAIALGLVRVDPEPQPLTPESIPADVLEPAAPSVPAASTLDAPDRKCHWYCPFFCETGCHVESPQLRADIDALAEGDWAGLAAVLDAHPVEAEVAQALDALGVESGKHPWCCWGIGGRCDDDTAACCRITSGDCPDDVGDADACLTWPFCELQRGDCRHDCTSDPTPCDGSACPGITVDDVAAAVAAHGEQPVRDLLAANGITHVGDGAGGLVDLAGCTSCTHTCEVLLGWPACCLCSLDDDADTLDAPDG